VTVGGLAVVGGHSILGVEGAVPRDCVLVQRHRSDGVRTVPAHLVDHASNMRSVVEQGCDRVLAISSVGGLRAEIGVGSFVACDDFVALGPTPSIYADFRGHSVPGLSAAWRDCVVDAWRAHADRIVPLRVGGVYWQSVGPRFETPAEIRFIAQHADVVGMTMASECVVARELGLEYACVCVVDNLANGVGPRPLSREEYEAGKRANQATLLDALRAVVPELS
jgi:5'-methylthioadenosine phosphorylase